MDLQFHLQAFELMILSFILYEQKVDHASSPRPPVPLFFSLTIPKRQPQKKQQKQVTKSFP